MIQNEDDNESSRYNIDISHSNSVTCREGDSRRRNLIRNSFPFKMVEHYDDDIEVEDSFKSQNYNKDKYENSQRTQLYQDEIYQQENVDDMSVDYRNEQLLKDSMTFNNFSKGQKINNTPINKFENFSNVESMHQNTNSEEFHQFQCEVQMNTSQQYPINQSIAEYQYESNLHPHQICNLNQSNIPKKETLSDNNIQHNDHVKNNSHQSTSLNIIQSQNQYTKNGSKPTTNTEVITVSLNSVNYQNSQNIILDKNQYEYQNNKTKYIDGLISIDKSDQHLKLMSSHKNISELGSRIIDNMSSQITPMATPVGNSASNRLNRRSSQNIVIQGMQGYNKSKLEEIKEFFKKTQYIKRFITNLKNRASTYIFRHINRSQFNFISDKSAEFSYYQDKGMLSEKLQKDTLRIIQIINCVEFNLVISILLIQKLSKKELAIAYLKNTYLNFLSSEEFTIQPESLFTLSWQAFLVFIYLVFIFLLPIDNNFHPQSLQNFRFIHILPLLVIPLDSFIKLNTAIYKRGMISKNREAILKEFLKNDANLNQSILKYIINNRLDSIILLIYLISQIFPLLLMLEYVITAKVFDVVRIIQSIFQRYDREFKYTTASKIIVLIVIILTFLHTQAAVFTRIGLNQMDSQNNWINNLLKDDTSSQNIYIHSLYWSIMTMATVGYGDVHPVSQEYFFLQKVEIVYVSIVSLISCGIYGYGLNQIGQIVNDIQKKNENHSKQMQILNTLMSQRQLDKHLQNQVRQYYEYLYKQEQINDETAYQLFSLLPQAIKNKLLFDLNHKLLFKQKLFSLNFSKEFLNKLSLEMKIQNLGPDIEIFNKGDIDERIYFITKGTVDVSIDLNSKQKTCYLLEKGDMLGELEFFTKETRTMSAKTVGVVTLTYLEFKDFFKCLQQFQNDLEKYYFIKDKARLYGNISGLSSSCKGCEKFSHQFLNCPSLNLVINQPKIIKEAQKSEDQQRIQSFKRFQRKKLNAFYKFEQNKKGYTQIICYDENTDDIINQSLSMRQDMQQASNNDDTNSKQMQPDSETFSQLIPDSLTKHRHTLIESEVGRRIPQIRRMTSKKSTFSQQSRNDQRKSTKDQEPRTPTGTNNKRKLLFDITSKDNQIFPIQPNQSQQLYLIPANQSQINVSSMNYNISSKDQLTNISGMSPKNQKYLYQHGQTLPMNRSIILQNQEVEQTDTANDTFKNYQEETYKVNGDLSLVYDTMVGYSMNQVRLYVNQSYFDTHKIYKCYFPHNNISSVLKGYSKYLKLKSQKIRKKNRFTTQIQYIQ